MSNPPNAPDPEQLATARDVLLALIRLPGPWPSNDRVLADLVQHAARVVQRDRKERQAAERHRDADLRDGTGIRGGVQAQPAGALARPVTCYICKQPFEQLHSYYDSLCARCAALNFARRHRSTDLRGRTALVTGGRIRSGYHTVLKLLRAGAAVVATTRFPRDAARRFATEPDARDWVERLQLVGLDLRAVHAVEQFAEALSGQCAQLDIFISNAAQTVRRPPAYYRALVAGEREAVAALPPIARDLVAREAAFTALVPARGAGSNWHAELALVPLAPGDTSEEEFLTIANTADGGAIDLRHENSWGLLQESVSTVELFEVHAINCLAPFLLLRALRGLFRNGPARDRFAVMVSAVEGQFAAEKSTRHPHTNMAKAALNMMVRTSAPERAADRVFLTAVDPGWFSVQQAAPAAERLAADGARLPLDAEDAAARILDPVFTGIETGAPASGVLFKDYRVVPW
jgi:NAD(P)-dependent dehydrogenase (short-subunit alcohol dehydrogenase family)